MERPPTAARDMTDDEFADFTDQMRLSVAEEAYLWELPAGSRDLTGDNNWLEHGPWQQADCAAAILLWFDAGLVSLLRRWPEEQPLTAEEERQVLITPESWVLDERPVHDEHGTSFAVAATEAGDALAWDEWRALLSVLRGR